MDPMGYKVLYLLFSGGVGLGGFLHLGGFMGDVFMNFVQLPRETSHTCCSRKKKTESLKKHWTSYIGV